MQFPVNYWILELDGDLFLNYIFASYVKEEFEDTKGIIRIRKSKDRTLAKRTMRIKIYSIDIF